MNQMRVWVFLLSALALTVSAVAGQKSQSFSVKRGGLLQVKVDAGDITVVGSNEDEVSVRAESLNEEQLRAVTMTQEGGTVLVQFRWNHRRVEDMAFNISVPSSFNIDIMTAGGGLNVQGPLSGDLKGSTAGGSIDLGTLGGSIRMETAGGEISAGDISGDINLETAGGEIALKSVTGAAEISTAGGGISVGNVGKGLRASTAGGDIFIGAVGGDIEVSTAGGEITVKSGRGEIRLSTAGGNVELASGRGHVSANTSGGNIHLGKIEGSVRARSAAGDIELTLNPAGDEESSSIETSAGNIVLTIPPEAHATISARAQTESGDEDDDSGISSDYPMTHPGGKRNQTQGEVLLNGGGQRIRLDAMIGSITIRKPQ